MAKAANIKAKEDLDKKPIVQKLQADAMKETQDVLREAAFTGFVVYNMTIDEFKLLSQNPKDWVISKMYPISKGGALWVDEPQTGHQLALTTQKKEIMKKLGRRYVVVTTKPDLHEFMQGLAHVDGELQGAFIE